MNYPSSFRYFIHDEGIYEIVIDGEKVEIYGFALKRLVAMALVREQRDTDFYNEMD